MHALHRRNPSRPGFTLTELIISMSIILILGTLGVALLPRLRGQERAARGADQLQRWLLIAKQRALSDRAPAGLRLIVDPNDPNVVTELHYIGVPDFHSKGRFETCNPAGTQSTFSGAEFQLAGLDPEDQPVQPGDYLEVYGGGLVMLITGVSPTTLTHTAWAQPGMSPTSNYRVIRQPRRIQGENPLRLPQDIGIDLARDPSGNALNSRNIPRRTVGGREFWEILFAPAGGVVGRGTTADKIIFWVRDVTVADPKTGSPTLITVYTRTGLIAAHPVDINGTDPYSFTKDPRSSGL